MAVKLKKGVSITIGRNTYRNEVPEALKDQVPVKFLAGSSSKPKSKPAEKKQANETTTKPAATESKKPSEDADKKPAGN